MASQGPNYPSTATNDGSDTVTWSTPENTTSSNNAYAYCTNLESAITKYLKLTNYGFTIPAGSTIDGILVTIEKWSGYASDLLCIKDHTLNIVKSNGSYGTTNKALTTTKWPTVETNVDYGGSSDLWGETWTASDINDVDFGIGLKALVVNSLKGLNDGYVDTIGITVYYTEGSSAAVKTIAGIAVANIKTIMGIVIGNVKSYFGITK